MSKIVFDLETNGLLDELNTIHCIGYVDISLDVDDQKIKVATTEEEIEETIKILQSAEVLIGHNIVRFDIPAIQKVFPEFKPQGKQLDTLVLSHLVKANLLDDDFTNTSLPEGFLKRMYGSHSLKAWGMRIDILKDDYEGGWEEGNQEMYDYCAQDVEVTKALYYLLMAEGFTEESIEFEHELNEICFRIGNNGWNFDVEKAAELYGELADKRIQLEKQLQECFPPWTVETPFIPKVNNAKLGYKKGEPFIKKKEVQFNPNSRKHIHKCLKDKYPKIKFTKWTPSGDPKLDESVLVKMPYPEAKLLAEMFLLQKRIGQLAEGKNAWLKLVSKDGKLRHTIISNSTVSARCSHRSPNIAQVPSTRAVYGKQCRELFTVPKGWYLCGSDLQALELRCLAGFLDDGGEYGRQIIEEDIHTYNQKAAGLETRSQSKEFAYSLIYGAGDTLLGKIVGGNAKDGKRLKEEFYRSIPAFKRLKDELHRAYKARGFIRGIDGRRLYVRSEHRLLSQLLQSTGSIVSKNWLRLIDKEIKKQKLKSTILAYIHDEVQISCPTEEEAHHVGRNIAGRMAQKAKDPFRLQIGFEASYSISRDWSGSH